MSRTRVRETKGWNLTETHTDQVVGQSQIDKLEGGGGMEGSIDQRRRVEGGGHGGRGERWDG